MTRRQAELYSFYLTASMTAALLYTGTSTGRVLAMLAVQRMFSHDEEDEDDDGDEGGKKLGCG